MRQQIYLDTIKNFSREEVLAWDYFFLDDWSIPAVDFGRHANDREVVRHALLSFDRYYHIEKFPDEVFQDRELMLEYCMRQAHIVDCGLWGGFVHAEPRLKKYQDTSEFFGELLDMVLTEIESRLSDGEPASSRLLNVDDFIISGLSELGFAGHVPHAARWLERYAKMMGGDLLSSDHLSVLDYLGSDKADKLEVKAIREYIQSREARAEAAELETAIKPATAADRRGGRL